MQLTPLNRKEVKRILEQINSEYGCDAKDALIDEYSFFISDKNKIYLMTNAVKDVDLSRVRVNSFGLYFAELSYGNIRLSMEGSFIVGKIATKNILDVDNLIAREWLKGVDIESKDEFNGFVIIRNGNDYLGCGKFKEGKILNYVPKPRRINE
jgi:NOL1/NOP2/fmu family ribosome biogenesis protein